MSDSGFMFALDLMEVSEGLKGFGILLDIISFVVNLPSEKKMIDIKSTYVLKNKLECFRYEQVLKY